MGGGSQPIILVKISSEQTHNGGGEVSSDITPSRPVMLNIKTLIRDLKIFKFITGLVCGVAPIIMVYQLLPP